MRLAAIPLQFGAHPLYRDSARRREKYFASLLADIAAGLLSSLSPSAGPSIPLAAVGLSAR